MDYSNKLKQFTIFLENKDIEILHLLSPLGINQKGAIMSLAEFGNHYTQAHWDKFLVYWNEFNII